LSLMGRFSYGRHLQSDLLNSIERTIQIQRSFAVSSMHLNLCICPHANYCHFVPFLGAKGKVPSFLSKTIASTADWRAKFCAPGVFVSLHEMARYGLALGRSNKTTKSYQGPILSLESVVQHRFNVRLNAPAVSVDWQLASQTLSVSAVNPKNSSSR